MESRPPPPEQPERAGPQAPYTPISGSPEAPVGGWEHPIAGPPGPAGRPLASWGRRVAATLLDWLILVIPVVALIVLVVAVALSSDVGAVVTGIVSGLAYLVAVLLYASLLMAREGAHNGQTWGKQVVGITVIRDSGQQVDFGYGFLREFVVKGLLFGFVGLWFFSIPTLLDYLWPLWDDQNRCLHDMVVKSHVVRV